MEAGLMKNHGITEMEAGFMLKMYDSLSVIEAGLKELFLSVHVCCITKIESGLILGFPVT